MLIQKRNNDLVKFDKTKISKAIYKAMKSCGVATAENSIKADIIANLIEEEYQVNNRLATIYTVEKMVYDYLVEMDLSEVARIYEGYRAVQEYKRKTSTIDKSVTALLSRNNDDIKRENSNKNPTVLCTGRDYVAGEFSKDYMLRIALPDDVATAHQNGILHYHDLDFAMQPMINCCLINIEDILNNGTVLNGKFYESPATFEKACGIVAQVIAQITSNQYGGNSINMKHLGKFLKQSEDRIRAEELRTIQKFGGFIEREEDLEKEVKRKLKSVCRAGIRSLLWQINGFSTVSGQSPFCTLFLEIEEGSIYEKYQALVVEQIIQERYNGMLNEQGVAISPAFPKLIFVLDENNVHKDSKYYYIKRQAVVCSAKRLVPDYISAKQMRKHYEGNVFSPMGCRSKLSVWYDENGKPKFEGRFNMGVVSLNLVQIALIAKGNEEYFWEILEQRLELCKKALMFRYNWLKGTPSDVSPLHWQFGGLARLKKGEKIDKLLEGGYATISLGYIGIYETTKAMLGVSHTTPEGKEFALKVMEKLKNTVELWKKQTGLGFGLYGTPSEGLCNRFCKIDRDKFGSIKDITEKGWYTNSFHVDVREEINAFDKLAFESEFQRYSTGGYISYIEVANMNKNIDALEQVIDYGYNTTVYFEINTKSDYCMDCSFDGELQLDGLTWYCPNCGNRNFDKLHLIRRTCGYLGENEYNEGKTKEISQRVLHL